MKALLVALQYQVSSEEAAIDLQELTELCHACDITITQTIIQKALPTRPYFVGKGKVEEIRLALDEEELIVFNKELSPLQINNLHEALDIEIIDRTDLILRIFESRATTKEARLQVKIAKLRYEMPRLAGWNEALYSQQGGSGFRGAGEKQIELDRRRIRRAIAQANKELETLRKTRDAQRHKRKKREVKVASLVGYTNAGKSTLLNYFTEKKVFSEDMLFATLETSTRQVTIKGHQLLLSDTVGFISDLPHHLIEAFKSTLEEVTEADLIIEVIDASSTYAPRQINVTRDVLEALGVHDTPVLYVYNKIDLGMSDVIIPEDPHVFVSLKDGTGIDALEQAIIDMLFQNEVRLSFCFPYEKGELFQDIRKNVTIIEERYEDEGIILVADAPIYYQERYRDYLKKNV